MATQSHYKAGLPGTKETFLFQVLIVKSAESQAACRDKASGMNKYYAAGAATFCCVKEDKSRNKAANYEQTKTGPYGNIDVRQVSVHLQTATLVEDLKSCQRFWVWFGWST